MLVDLRFQGRRNEEFARDRPEVFLSHPPRTPRTDQGSHSGPMAAQALRSSPSARYTVPRRPVSPPPGLGLGEQASRRYATCPGTATRAPAMGRPRCRAASRATTKNAAARGVRTRGSPRETGLPVTTQSPYAPRPWNRYPSSGP